MLISSHYFTYALFLIQPYKTQQTSYLANTRGPPPYKNRYKSTTFAHFLDNSATTA